MSMRWSVIIAACVTWLTVTVLLAWRPSVRGALSYLRSSRYSLPTVLNPNSLGDVDPARVQHDGKCENCGVQAAVPLSRTRLERAPWRIVWWCEVCGRQSRAICPDELVPVFVKWDRAGGMGLSMREVADMVGVSLDVVQQAIEDELL